MWIPRLGEKGGELEPLEPKMAYTGKIGGAEDCYGGHKPLDSQAEANGPMMLFLAFGPGSHWSLEAVDTL